MLLEGKRLLITGVLTPQSIAFGVAEVAQKEGAEVALTGLGRGMSLTERSARRLNPVPPVIELVDDRLMLEGLQLIYKLNRD